MQIENGYRRPSEKRPGAVERGTYREIEAANGNPDAEPVLPCAAARPAIIVFGKRLGTTLTVCTDDHCPVHDPRAAAEREAKPAAPVMTPAPEVETDEEAEQRRADHEQRRKEYEAEQVRKQELRQAREATYHRILANAPATVTAAQLRVVLRALVNLDPFTFADDLAEEITAEDGAEDNQRSAEETLLSVLDATADEKLTRFALRLALSGHRDPVRDGELDFLAEADAVFTAPQPETRTNGSKKAKKPTLVTKPKARIAKTVKAA